MANRAFTAKNATLTIKVGTGAAVAVAGITGFNGLGDGSASVLDATDLDSVKKEKQIGLADEGQVSPEMNYLPDDNGQKALVAARTSGDAATFVWKLKSGKTYTFDGFVLKFGKSFSVDTIVKASVAIEITGDVTEGGTSA